MTFWVLPQTCKVLARSTLTPLTEDELKNPEIQGLIAEHDTSIKSKIGDSLVDDEIDNELIGLYSDVPDDVLLPEDDVAVDHDACGDARQKLTTLRLKLIMNNSRQKYFCPAWGQLSSKAKVTGRKRDADGNPIGKSNANPIMDTQEYEVEFPDGATEVFTANIIAENLFAQVDDEGNSYAILHKITDHKKVGTVVNKDNGFVTTEERGNSSTIDHTETAC